MLSVIGVVAACVPSHHWELEMKQIKSCHVHLSGNLLQKCRILSCTNCKSSYRAAFCQYLCLRLHKFLQLEVAAAHAILFGLAFFWLLDLFSCLRLQLKITTTTLRKNVLAPFFFRGDFKFRLPIFYCHQIHHDPIFFCVCV